MTYSCTDLADEVLAALVKCDAIRMREVEDSAISEDPEAQAKLILVGIERLVVSRAQIVQIAKAHLEMANASSLAAYQRSTLDALRAAHQAIATLLEPPLAAPEPESGPEKGDV